MKKLRLRAVIWDFDDTLVLTRESRIPLLIMLANQYGYDVTVEQIMMYWGIPFNELIQRLMPGVNFPHFYDSYLAVLRSTSPIRAPGALEVLQILAKYKIINLVITSGSHELVYQDLFSTGLAQYITRIWGFEDTEFHKPHPKTLYPISLELEKAEISIENTGYIGDSTTDYLLASHWNIPFCAVLTGTNDTEDFIRLGLKKECIVNSIVCLLSAESWLMTNLTQKIFCEDL